MYFLLQSGHVLSLQNTFLCEQMPPAGLWSSLPCFSISGIFYDLRPRLVIQRTMRLVMIVFIHPDADFFIGTSKDDETFIESLTSCRGYVNRRFSIIKGKPSLTIKGVRFGL